MKYHITLLSILSIACAFEDGIVKCPQDATCKGKPYGTYIHQDWIPHDNVFFKCHPSKTGAVALAFTGAPDKTHVSTLLDALKKNSTRATFFVSGTKLKTDEDFQSLKEIEDAGHTIALGGMTDQGLGMDNGKRPYADLDTLYEKEFQALIDLINQHTDYGALPYFYPPYESWDNELADFLEEKGIKVIFSNLDWEEPTVAEAIEGNVETHIVDLYADGAAGSKYRADVNSELSSYMPINNAENKDHTSFISHISASRYNNEKIYEYFSKTVNTFNYRFIDMKECLLFEPTTEFRDIRAVRCMGAPCENADQCRVAWGDCVAGNNEGCTNERALYIPACAIDISLAEVNIPPTQSCSGEPCDTLDDCRNALGKCGGNSTYCNDESIWSRECAPTASPTTDIPTASPITPSPTRDNCGGTPCPNAAHCRKSNGKCGFGEDFCNKDSLWLNDCTVSNEVPTDTGIDSDTKCIGDPCGSTSECRNPIGECGIGEIFCNEFAIWSKDECGEGETAGANANGFTITIFGAVALALAL